MKASIAALMKKVRSRDLELLVIGSESLEQMHRSFATNLADEPFDE
jgi:hypothetical protein